MNLETFGLHLLNGITFGALLFLLASGFKRQRVDNVIRVAGWTSSQPLHSFGERPTTRVIGKS